MFFEVFKMVRGLQDPKQNTNTYKHSCELTYKEYKWNFDLKKVTNMVVKLTTRLCLFLKSWLLGDVSLTVWNSVSTCCSNASGYHEQNMKSCHVTQTTINSLWFECVNVSRDRRTMSSEKREQALSHVHMYANKYIHSDEHTHTSYTLAQNM